MLAIKLSDLTGGPGLQSVYSFNFMSRCSQPYWGMAWGECDREMRVQSAGLAQLTPCLHLAFAASLACWPRAPMSAQLITCSLLSITTGKG